MPDNDLIRRGDAIKALRNLPTWWADEGGVYGNAQPPMEAMLDPVDALSAIDNLPAADIDEIRGKGKWVDKGVRAWSCSCCGMPLNHIRQFASFEKNELPNYCPNCGARMEANQ